MEIEPIGAIGEVSASLTVAADLPLAHPSQSQVAITEANAREAETTEQLAEDGDPIAEAKLAGEEKQHTPLNAQTLLPAHLENLVGAHEAGKGDLIDTYD